MTASHISLSVAMATFNGARYLGEQLDSLARQNLLPCELQVGDDGSSDDTLAILDDFTRRAPFPVHVHRNTVAGGYGENFLQTASRCGGEWIAFCDQDDVWAENKLSTIAALAAEHGPDIQLIVHDAVVVDEQLKGKGERLYEFPAFRLVRQMELEPTTFWAGFLMTFRSELVHDIAVRPRARLPHAFNPAMPSVDLQAHDSWIPLLAGLLGSILIIPDALALYRRHEFTATSLVDDQGAGRRLAAAAANHAERYDFLGEWYAETAQLLAAKAAESHNSESAAALKEGADRMIKQSALFASRARLHSAPTIIAALSAQRELLRSAAYTDAPWPLAKKSLLKDLLAILRRGTG